MKRSSLETGLVYAAVALFVLVTLLPLTWLFILSVSIPADLTVKPLALFPHQVTFAAYRTLLTFDPNTAGENFLLGLRNSLGASLGAAIMSMTLAIPAAWAFSRYRERLVAAALYGVLATYMTPAVALALPLYFALASLHLLNNVLGLAVVYCAILTPFSAWFLKASFDAVPAEIEQAATMDGASVWGTLWYVTLPLARAGVSTAMLFAVLLAWDEFFFALLFTSNGSAKTLPVTIADFAAGRATNFGLVAAAGLMTALPPVLIALGLQRSLVAGLTAGGVKG